MFTVYKITNQINQKCYIGSSIQVEKRWQQHRNCAFNPNSHCYKYPLYCAFRKYGLNNFLFEILKNDFSSIEEMQEYEYQMILFYDSYKNGYNQTLNTTGPNLENLRKSIITISQKCAAVDKNNNIIEIFPSYHAAARKYYGNKTDMASRVRKICKGDIRSDNNYIFRDIDDNNQIIIPDFKTRNRRKSLICISLDNPENEYYYDSISSAAKVLTNGERREIQLHLQGSKRYSTIYNYLLREIDENGNIIDNGISIEEKIIEYNRTNPEINGERHNITDWCKIFNITTQTYYYRLKQGYDIITALTMPKRR